MAKILIVDDVRINRELVSSSLKATHPDYSFLFAQDGPQALEIADEQVVDIVLLDIMMPNMDGFEVCRRLKQHRDYVNTPVLMITALDRIDDKLSGFQAGASDYIVKPFNGVEINARVEAHLRIKQYQDELKDMNEQLRKAQEALVLSARMSSIGTLAAGVAHEFNNILGIMKGYLTLYGGSEKLEELHKGYGIINDLVGRGSEIVKGLLNFSREKKDEKKTVTDVNRIVRETLELVKKKVDSAGVEFDVEYDDLPEIACLPGQLSQVIFNLVNNAIDAMVDKQTRQLVVETCMEKGQDGENDCVCIKVTDTGGGIPEEIREKVMEPFFTTKGVLGGGSVTKPGTGLGLSICFEIMQRHGGSLSFESRPGQGTTFFVRIPVS